MIIPWRTLHKYSGSARPEFLGVIDDPLFENLGSLANLEGQNFFNV